MQANDAQLFNAIKRFRLYLETQERELGLRSRSRTPSAKRSFVLAMEAVCCNLLIATMIGPGAALAIPLAHKTMWGQGRYANVVYGQHFLDIIDLLARLT